MAVLGQLFRNGDQTVGDLASAEQVQPPSMTRTVKNLEAGGYVVRRPHDTDGRQVVISISERGTATVRADRARRDAWLSRRLADLTPERTRRAAPGRPILASCPARTEPPIADPTSPTFQALRNPNYRKYAVGSVVSNTGTWMQRVAQDWLVLQLTGGSGSALGITTGLQFLPVLLLSPYAGVIADRFPKRRLLQVTQAVMAAAVADARRDRGAGVVEVWHVYVLAFVFGIGSAFDAPARQSFVSEMVGQDEVTNAVGLNSAAFNLARMLGPALAGLMIGALGRRRAGDRLGDPDQRRVTTPRSSSSCSGCDPALLNTPSPRPHAGDAPRRRPLRAQPAQDVDGPGAGLLRRHLRHELPDHLRPDGHRGLRQGAGEFGLLGSFMAIGSLAGALMSARRSTIRRPAARRGRPGVRRRRDRGRPDAVVRALRALMPGDRLLRADPAQLRQRDHAAGVRPRLPRAGDGALHDHRDGRHPARLAGDRLGRRDLRAPVDPDRRRRPRHRRCGVASSMLLRSNARLREGVSRAVEAPAEDLANAS